MDIFLPIAGMSYNFLVIAGIGGLVGFLSGLFWGGGGFLLTPLRSTKRIILLCLISISPTAQWKEIMQ